MTLVPLEMSRFMTPVADAKHVYRPFRWCRAGRFDIVNTFTHKPNIRGAIAPRLAGCLRVAESVTGLSVKGVGSWLLRRVFLLHSHLRRRASTKLEVDPR